MGIKYDSGVQAFIRSNRAFIYRVIVFACLILGARQSAQAGGVVSTPTDADLRAAVAGGGLVTFTFDGTVILTNTLIITSDSTIDGTGHTITLSGSNATRLFIVQQGKSLSLQNLTLADGLALGTNGAPVMAGGSGQGGAIFNGGGTVFGTGCNFLRNTARGGVGGSNDPGVDAWGNAGTGGTGQGGAIFNLNGQMLFTNSLFSENTALGGAGGPTPPGLGVSTGGVSAGGAVYSTGGLVSFVDCLISSSRSVSGRGQRFGTPYGRDGVSSGGAMEIAGGQMVLRLSVISSNTSETANISDARGGAITQTGGTLEASDCLFAGNGAVGGVGLGISTGFPGGSAFGGGLCLLSGSAGLTNSTFSGNHAKGNQGANALLLPGAGAGGAVYSLINISLLNCTVAGNIAEAGGRSGSSDFQVQGGAYGGGLYNNGGTMMISEVTLSGNAAIPTIQSNTVALGGNLYSTNGTASLINTIIAYSLSGSNSSGVLTDLGHNLSSDSSCSFAGAGSLNNADPKLGPLDDYGGPTPTVPLLAGSPAIDAGDNANFPFTDQRGHARPYGSSPDIGAFESSPPYIIRGIVSGSTLTEEVLIAASSGNVSSTNHGSYRLEGLAANTYLVTPSSPNYLFLPNNRTITVGPDQLGVDFKAYHWNALSLDGVTNNVMHLVFAGTNGQTYRLLASTNLLQWFPVATNTIGASNYFECFIPMTNNGAQFFRTVNP